MTDIVITPEMIAAGVEAIRRFHFGEEEGLIVEAVYLDMEIERRAEGEYELGSFSEHFNDELKVVDPTKTITAKLSKSYGETEWSYNGLIVIGGSNNACEHAASELMYAMGFRWITPNPQFWIRPTSIPINLTRTKTSFWMPFNRIFLVYGHSWAGSNAASRTLLSNRFTKWATLHNWRTDVYPAGHRWTSIIDSNPEFFSSNPQLLLPGARNFNLSVAGDDYDNLVMLSAAQLLKDGLNAWRRTHFDATDGDRQSSDLVFEFSKAVAEQVRLGTAAIGTHPARAGVPDAQLGIYAYAGHRMPPTNSVAPFVYTQVALGFNQTPLSYPQLVEQHGAKAAAILIREYLDTQAWSDGLPMVNNRTKVGYFNRYDEFVSSMNVIGSNSELGANWLVNLVMTHYAIRKFKTGNFTYEQALDDVMPLFGNDLAVRSLYNFWSDPFQTFSNYALRVSMQLVTAMRDDWYKIHFQRFLTILYAREKLPAKNPTASDDSFPAAFTKYMGWVTGVRDDDIIHSYAYVRQEANAAMNPYPALKFDAKPEPQWFANPTVPTVADFETAFAQILIETERDEDLDSNDLVLAKHIIPRIAETPPATKFCTHGRARYLFVVESGIGTVTLTEATTSNTPLEGGVVETEEFGVGIHSLGPTGGRCLATWTNGYLFLDTFPLVEKRSDATKLNHWLYIPKRHAGNVNLVVPGGGRWRFKDQNGVLNLYDVLHASYKSPANLGPGQIAVDNTNTSGVFENYNGNRYLSAYPNVALLPRVIVEEEGLQ